MTMHPKALPISKWPLGVSEDALMLNLSPEQIGRRKGLSFEDGIDDLDAFKAVVLNLGAGRVVALQAYANSPVKGTVLVTRDGDRESVQAFVRWFAPYAGEIRWTLDAFRPAIRLALKAKAADATEPAAVSVSRG